MNSHSEHTLLVSARLRVDPAAGQVQAGAECIRLGPVNMKVLALLLESANRVVTRAEFFERVWKQQLVSDDVLTRSISDLRTLLGAHADVPVLIETIPKRGYRWVPPVETAPAGLLQMASAPLPEPRPLPPPSAAKDSAAKDSPAKDSPAKDSRGIRVLYWGAGVLAGFLILSSLVLWISGSYFASGRVKVALLPIQTDATAQQQLATELATELERLIREQMLDSPQFELLSYSATSLYLQNPFPVLAREYGVNYVLEGRIQTYQAQSVITLNLVDARSASVIDSFAADIDEASDLRALSESFTDSFGLRLGVDAN